MYLKLIPKSNRGKNAHNRANKPDHWIVKETREMVGFSDKPGPWYYVVPDSNNGEEHMRWINATNDADFTVEILK